MVNGRALNALDRGGVTVRLWPISLGVFGAMVLVNQLWPLKEAMWLVLTVELLALVVAVGLAMGEKHG